ncbi:fido domain-containing protein [Dactylonectria macrodidyma]|uniref:Fido domain-containing protein n=1 Tax=Dactylonectria macrodidyma TaxID=307937 RepID=A0A9P9F6Q1_9HYPO|nr:fido domain-containing protein [Dactylonectria macrodidyma]
MGSALGTVGSIRVPWQFRSSFTIVMDEAYDYNLLESDPDVLHAEFKGFVDGLSRALQDHEVDPHLFEDYLNDSLARMVYGSNMIESAGGGFDITMKLCRAVFRGEIPQFREGTDDYEAMERHLVQKNLPYDTSAVHRCHREIVQHAVAAAYLFSKVYIKGEDLSEIMILKIHCILTDQIDTEQGISWDEYSGMYREHNVSAGLHQFPSPYLVPRAMRDMIKSFNEDIRAATECGKIDPVALAAKYCHTFVNIHPFLDGNGRVCRLILNLLLLKYGGVLVCIGEEEEDRDKYLGIAASASLARAYADDLDDLDESHRPKHYKELASFTLQHAHTSMRKLTELMNRE